MQQRNPLENEMQDYDVWYKGQVIANVCAETDRKALNLARKIYVPLVTVTRC